MATFKLPEDFNPEVFNYKQFEEESHLFGENPKLKRSIEIRRLNKLGAQISDYLSLIKSANLQLSNFESLSLAIELHKVESLKEIEVTGKVDAGISGSLSIDDNVYVQGDITTS